MKKFLIQAGFIVVCICMLATCKDDKEKEIDIITDPSSLTMIAGEEALITARPVNLEFTWESSNTNVASVSSTGLVKAHSEGDCFITVKSGNSSSIVPVEVVALIPVSEIGVSPTSLDLLLDASQKLETVLLPANHNDYNEYTIRWQSSDTDVATVDNNGNVEAVGVGEADIKVWLEQRPEVETIIPVSVNINPVALVPSETYFELKVSETATVTISFNPEDHDLPDATLEWESSDNTIVTATNGELHTLKTGKAIITASLKIDPRVKVEIEVVVYTEVTLDLSTFTDLIVSDGAPPLKHKKVLLGTRDLVTIAGMSVAEVEQIYNRDFFEFNETDGTLKFTGESDEWDIYYHYPDEGLKYIFIQGREHVYPKCYWIAGQNVRAVPQRTGEGNSWSNYYPRGMGYMKYVREGVYQGTVYLYWPSFHIRRQHAYSRQVQNPEIRGDDWQRFTIRDNEAIECTTHALDAFYKITYDESDNSLTFEKYQLPL